MASKQHRIEHITDLLALSQEELTRMIPDLLAWHQVTKGMIDLFGAKPIDMIWVDDGRPAELFKVTMNIKDLDEVVEFRGPAWEESIPAAKETNQPEGEQ